MRPIRLYLIAPIVLGLLQPASRVAHGDFTFTTITSFNTGPNAAGVSGLSIDAQGNLYGTTSNGGSYGNNGFGTVFKIAAGTDAVSTIASFNQTTNGGAPPGGAASPSAGPIVDAQGNLYGTTTVGGANGVGTVYEIAAGTSTISTLANFSASGGTSLPSGLTLDAQGNLYGTTQQGGAYSDGTVFKVAAGTNTLSTLFTFNASNSANGYAPIGQLTIDSQGNLYGTTYDGGAKGYGGGTVFTIAAGTSTLSTLASFGSPNNLSLPSGNLVRDAQGNLYGTTVSGGVGGGAIYEIAAGTGILSILYSFSGNGNDGFQPFGGLTIDAQGNLYGTTRRGGIYGDGTVFELAAGTDVLTTLFSFDGSDGSAPYSTVTIDSQGDLFGTTTGGGAYNDGTVFELVNNPAVVPEPASIVALGQAALVGIGLAIRARARRVHPR